MFVDFVDRIYPIELEIKDATYTDRSASCLDIHLEIDNEGKLRTKLHGKRDDFNFPIYMQQHSRNTYIGQYISLS